METFYEWLKHNRFRPEKAKEVKSEMIYGYIDLPIAVEEEAIGLSKFETGRLIKMENYVTKYLNVTNEMFDEMLANKHLKKYQTLAKSYTPVDGGIAEDLRNEGWNSIAKYIAHNRNIDNSMDKITKPNKLHQLNLPKMILKKFNKNLETQNNKTEESEMTL